MSNKGVVVIEGHVQGLSNVRALGERNIPVYVVDKSECIARYSKFCCSFFRCPDYLSNGFISFLIELAKTHQLKDWILMPSNDHAVYNISKNKVILEEYYKIITPGIDVIDNIYDKGKLLEIAVRCNIPFPKTQYFKSANESIEKDFQFPLLTKGRNGLTFYKSTGRKVFLAESLDELRNQLIYISEKYSLEKTFTQELIPDIKINKTISFTAFAVEGEIKTYWIGEKLREHPIRFGTATYTQSIECLELYNPSQNLLKELNYTGVCEIEYLLDPRDKTYKLIEINARTWLWVELAKRCNINYALIIYNYLNNLKVDYKEEYIINKKWMHYITDLPYSIIAILKGKYSVIQIIKSYCQFPSPAVFRANDILPFFAEFFILPLRFFKK